METETQVFLDQDSILGTMATPPPPAKPKSNHRNLSRSKSLTTQKERRTKPKPNTEPTGSTDQKDHHKPGKPIPNYLKPTISSRLDPVKFLRKNKNNVLEDDQKLLRRRSFDRPPSSLTAPQTSLSCVQKSLNISPGRRRDRPLVPREKPATASRSSSFHSNRNSSKPNHRAATQKTQVTSRAINPTQKTCLSTASNSKKAPQATASGDSLKKVLEASAAERGNERASIEGNQESHPAVPEVEDDTVKVATETQVADLAPQSEVKEVQVESVQSAAEQEQETDKTCISLVSGSPVMVAKLEELIEEDPKLGDEKFDNEIQEAKEEDKEQENNGVTAEGEVEANPEAEDDQKEEEENNGVTAEGEVEANPEAEDDHKEEEDIINSIIARDLKVAMSAEEETGGGVEEGLREAVHDDTSEAAESPEVAKRQVVQGGKKESPTAYNDGIEETRRKLLEERKNKVKALVGAFETVIDYESGASK